MSGRDIGASVRQRLLNRARSEDRPFQELLQYFAMERFLYRLAKSSFVDRFILKGALLLTAWRAPVTRPTIDIDLAGRTSNELEHIRSIVAELCQLNVEPDGLDFEPASIEAQRIKEDADYGGVRVRFNATLAKARIPMQIDIGFGDVIVPKPIDVEYPAMLEFPPPLLRAYPKETVVAEKLEALTVLGMLNSRIKDYYDVALLARMYSFEGALLVEAIRSTFLHRGTTAEASPVGLTAASARIRPGPFSGAPLCGAADLVRSGRWKKLWSRFGSSLPHRSPLSPRIGPSTSIGGRVDRGRDGPHHYPKGVGTINAGGALRARRTRALWLLGRNLSRPCWRGSRQARHAPAPTTSARNSRRSVPAYRPCCATLRFGEP